MSKVAKTLDKVLRGNADANISFQELCNLLEHLGFAVRVRGSHHIFTCDGVAEILNLQPKGGKAKADKAQRKDHAEAFTSQPDIDENAV